MMDLTSWIASARLPSALTPGRSRRKAAARAADLARSVMGEMLLELKLLHVGDRGPSLLLTVRRDALLRATSLALASRAASHEDPLVRGADFILVPEAILHTLPMHASSAEPAGPCWRGRAHR